MQPADNFWYLVLISWGKDSFSVMKIESYLAVLDALYDADIRFVLCRQEGQPVLPQPLLGQTDRRPGYLFCDRGPGATNASIGVHTAMRDSGPMILFVGQIGVGHKEREAFQEVDYRAFFGSMAKWATEIDDVDRMPEILARAWRIAISGHGPVGALPEDMLTAQTTAQPCRPVTVAEAGVDQAQMQDVAALLAAADRPLVLAGRGGWAAPELRIYSPFVSVKTSLWRRFSAITISSITTAPVICRCWYGPSVSKPSPKQM